MLHSQVGLYEKLEQPAHNHIDQLITDRMHRMNTQKWVARYAMGAVWDGADWLTQSDSDDDDMYMDFQRTTLVMTYSCTVSQGWGAINNCRRRCHLTHIL